MAELIDSLLHPLAERVRQILRREDPHHILVDDEENLAAALAAGLAFEALFCCERALSSRPEGVPVYEIARRTGKKLFESDKEARVFGIARAPPLPSLEDLAGAAGDLVVLEEVRIAGNVGAIVRTAAAFGAGGVVMLGELDPWDRRLIRASRGCVFRLPVLCATREALIGWCAAHEVDLAVTSPHARTPVRTLSTHPRRLALAFGSEREGCSSELRRAAPLHVQIPTMPGAVESLNVSAAASIALFARAERRLTPPGPPRSARAAPAGPAGPRRGT